VRPALGLRALARVVDEERVDERDVADRGVGGAGGRQAGGLARQPLQVAVLADVHHRVRGELLPQPVVGGQVVVAGRQVRVVIDRDRVRAEAARWLHHHHHVARPQRGQHDLAAGVVAAVDEQLTRWRPPVPGDRLAQLRVEGGEPGLVVAGADPDRIARQLILGQPRLVLPARRDDRVDQRVAVAVGHPGDLVAADVIAGLGHRRQQPDHRRGRVQPDGVANAGVLGRVRRQHDDDPPLARGDMPQPRVPDRDAGHPRGPLRIGDVAGEPVRAGIS